MRITIFGASGDVGSRIVTEALSRGHKVTAIIRNPAQCHQLPKGVISAVIDAANKEEIAHITKDQDLIISAVRPSEGQEYLLPLLTKSILSGASQSNTRSLIVGGAASLKIPGEEKMTVLTTPNFLPDSVIPIAQACQKQYEICINEKDADWSYISPPSNLVKGTRTGIYRLGTNELMTNAQGASNISMEDLAVALLDEAEYPKHQKTRFTVAY